MSILSSHFMSKNQAVGSALAGLSGSRRLLVLAAAMAIVVLGLLLVVPKTPLVDAAAGDATGTPLIIGTVQASETLTVDMSEISDVDGIDNATFEYQWISSDRTTDTDIAGATSSTYIIKPWDLGKQIKVRVSFTDDAGNKESLTSAGTAAVEASPNHPPSGWLELLGMAEVGQALRVIGLSRGYTRSIYDANGLTYATFNYQWIRDDETTEVEIPNATGQSYTLTDADEGKRIKVRLSFTDDGGNVETLTSIETNAVTAMPTTSDLAAPSAPTVGRSQGEEKGLELSWTAPEGNVDSYQILRTVVPPGFSFGYYYPYGCLILMKVHIRDTGSDATTYTDTDVVEGERYIYGVRAMNSVGVGRISSSPYIVQYRPDGYLLYGGDPGHPRWTPTNLASSQIKNGIGLTWEAPEMEVTGYQILRRSPEQCEFGHRVYVENTNSTDTHWADRNVVAGTLYEYHVRPVNDVGVVRRGISISTSLRPTTLVVGPEPNNPATGTPTIAGTPQVGETLTADPSGIADTDGMHWAILSYQWLSSRDTEIEGATSPTYTLQASDANKVIKVRVDFMDDSGYEESRISAATAAVTASLPDSPAHLHVFPHDAQALDLSWHPPGSDGGSQITGYKVHWKETDDSWDTSSEVSQATTTGTTHTINGLTDGQEYSVRVFASNEVGDSPPSEEVTGTPRETTPPQKVRTRVDGATLRVLYDEALDENSVPPANAFDVRVVERDSGELWENESARRGVDEVSINGDSVILTLASGATSEDYVVISYTPPKDEESSRVRDSAGNAAAGFEPTQAFNDTEEAPAGAEEQEEPDQNSPPTGEPTISGTVWVGETLTASTSGIADADGLVNAVFSYQWVRHDADMDGETNKTYELTDDDVGKTIKVRVTFTDDADNKETLTSAATAKVVAAPTTHVASQSGSDSEAYITVEITDGDDTVSWSDPEGCSSDYNLYLAVTAPGDDAETSRTHLGSVASGSNEATKAISHEISPSSSGVSSPPMVEVELYCGENEADNLVSSTRVAMGASNLREGTYSSAPLTALTISSGTLNPSFDRGIQDYDTEVPSDTESITLESTVLTGYFTVFVKNPIWGVVSGCWGGPLRGTCNYSYGDGTTTGIVLDDADEDTDGFQIDLGRGENRLGIGVNTGNVNNGSGHLYYLTVTVQNSPGTPHETTPPELAGATVDGGTLTLTYSEGLDEASEPETGAFNVAVNDTPHGVDEVSVSGNAVVLTLASAVAAGDTLSVTYTAPTGSSATPIRDLPGNAAASFGNQPVTNNTGTPINSNSAPTGLPVITGTAQVDETLTVDVSGIDDADGLDNATFSYQWIRTEGGTDTDIAGETDQTYSPSDADAGKSIKVRVTFTDDAENEQSLTSEPTAVVVAATTVPGQPMHLRVFPHDAQGLDLSWEAPASDGGSPVTGYRVQWKEADGVWDTPVDVSQETVSGTTHTIDGLTDRVEYVVRVIARNDIGDGAPSTEAMGTPRETTPPQMVMARVDGATLRVSYDEALDEDSVPSTDAFLVKVACRCDDTRWQDEEARRGVDGVSVDGDAVVLTLASVATAEDDVVISYTPPQDEASPRVLDAAGNAAAAFRSTLVFNDTEESGEEETAENAEPTGLPTISGTLRAGETLTAATSGIGDADGLDNASFSYQWMRSDGNSHTDLDGETGRTYELSGDDVGRAIKVRVSFRDDADNEESLTSAATGVVAPRPPLTASFQGQPSSHDGQADFTFELHFSEELPVSYLTLRDHAFTVVGGTVIKAQRLTQGSNIGWRITVQPDGNGDVTVALPATTDCDATGAVCTGDGRMLSNRNEFTVSGLGS